MQIATTCKRFVPMKLMGLLTRARPETDDPSEEDISSEGEALSDEEKPDIPLRVRFEAWWEGEDVEDILAKHQERLGGTDNDGVAGTRTVGNDRQGGGRASDAAQAANKMVEVDESDGIWSKWRIDVSEMVWGKGFTSYGGGNHAIKTVQPYNITSAMTLLVLGAGLGGPARAIAAKFDAWVIGLERSQLLAKAGMLQSVNAGMSKKAPINYADFEKLEFKENSFNCVYAKEALYNVENKEGLLEGLHKALRRDGPLLITDYMIGEGAEDSAELAAWIESEPLQPHLWTREQTENTLRQLMFDVRIVEDVTDIHRQNIHQAWAKYVNKQAESGIPSKLRTIVDAEAERWTRLVAALDSGGLRLIRICGLKKV
ncbi:MAG: methyltransferase domain-containing protein [Alphaproteobacteria bacterium]